MTRIAGEFTNFATSFLHNEFHQEADGKGFNNKQFNQMQESKIVNDIVTKGVHPQALMELQAILKRPYKDICVVCDGDGKTEMGGRRKPH